MSNRRFILTLILTAGLAGYTGWSYAKRVDLISSGSIELHGLQVSAPPPQIAGKKVREQLTPTMALSKCKVQKFRIDLASEHTERVTVSLEDISPSEFRCLLDQAQTALEGDPPWSPLSNQQPPRTFRPLLMTFEAQTK